MFYRKNRWNATNHLKYLYFSMIAICLFSSCYMFSTKVAANDIIVKHAFQQKEIPGQQDGHIQSYLNLKIEVLENKAHLTFDSIKYKNKHYDLKGDKNAWKILLEGEPTKLNSTSQLINSATLYYSTNNKKRTLDIPNVQLKEDLYLP